MRLNASAFAIVTSSMALLSHVSAQCGIALGASCGNSLFTLCCPANAYCQPWDTTFYQCLTVPSGCGEMETNVDYYGNDIGSVSHVSPEQCCAACSVTPGCNYFTFVNLDPQGPTCYMKSAKGTSVRNVGALSGRAIRQATPSPAPVCTIANGEYCGNAQATLCCSPNNYCQPWDSNYYQCVGVPQGCGELETDTDIIGTDIGSITNIQPWDCCTRCRENPACNYYSFVNTDPQGPTCYMKSAKTSSIRKTGILSGRAITKP